MIYYTLYMYARWNYGADMNSQNPEKEFIHSNQLMWLMK